MIRRILTSLFFAILVMALVAIILKSIYLVSVEIIDNPAEKTWLQTRNLFTYVELFLEV
jgi:hypothetical protein